VRIDDPPADKLPLDARLFSHRTPPNCSYLRS
jgi:hypothetical protein